MTLRDKIEHAIQNQPCTVKDLKAKFGGDRGADRKVMEAVDQHLNCNQPDCEKMYARYHYAAHKLGIVNQMTRAYLSEIPLTDL